MSSSSSSPLFPAQTRPAFVLSLTRPPSNPLLSNQHALRCRNSRRLLRVSVSRACAHPNSQLTRNDQSATIRRTTLGMDNAHSSSQPDRQPTSNHPSPPPPPPEEPDADSLRPFLIAVATLFVGGSLVAAYGAKNSDLIVSVATWFESLGPNSVYLYGLLYFVLELVAVPAIPLTLGSGYLFGVARGTAVVSVASTLAAAAAFLLARYGFRDSIMALSSRYPRFRAIDRAIERQGFKFVLLLRMSPLLPFSISNYLYGLTSVELPSYVAGSWLGMLPGTIAYVSAGAAVNVLNEINSGAADANPAKPLLVVLGVLATVGVLTFIGKAAAGVIEEEEAEAGTTRQ